MSEAWQVDSAEPGVMINNITISIMLLARLPPITITLIREAFRKRKSHVSFPRGGPTNPAESHTQQSPPLLTLNHSPNE